jgi:membrane-associated protease RseP (regulator of RpoE activity)
MTSELPPHSTGEAILSISFSELSSIVGEHFKIIQGFVDSVHGGIPTFIVEKNDNSKSSFEKLYRRLEARSLLPVIREAEEKGQYALRIFSDGKKLEGQARGRRKAPIQLTLLVATIATVTVAGYFISASWFQTETNSLGETLTAMVLYAAGLMAILTVHELGHMIASRAHLMKSSLPYFIPAPPIIPGTALITPGTFGALITQTGAPANRDQLFDLGVAGPFSGFLVSIIVTFIGISLSQPMPGIAEGIYAPPLILILLALFPGKTAGGAALSLHPLGLAGYIGLIITALNLFPVGQFDGGHISRAAFGPRGHERASTISLIFILVLGLISSFFLPFAILLIFFSFAGAHPGPLDDVSSITRGRKAVAIMGFIVLFLSLPMEYLRIPDIIQGYLGS